MVGIKVYNKCEDIKSAFRQWKDLGIDTIFPYPEHAQNLELKQYAVEYGIKLFLTIPIFHNPEYLKTNPSCYSIQADGKRAKDHWLEFICPSNKEYKNQRVDYIRNIIERFNPDGISLDFIRFFVFWEKVYVDHDPQSISQTCFDRDCLQEFKNYSRLDFPENPEHTADISSRIMRNHVEKWSEWKCHVIEDTVRQISESARKRKPEIELNVHTVPWRSEDFDGALRRIAGQDLKKMSVYTDYVSPMSYSHMLKRKPAWIHSVVKDISQKTTKKIIPCVQVGNMYIDNELTSGYFEESLSQAAKKPSYGIVLWSWKALDKSAHKKDILRKFLHASSLSGNPDRT